MSFNLGPINQPMIQSAQAMQNNGGGGNLGYMHQGKKKKDEENGENENLLPKITDEDTPDILQLEFDDGTKKNNNSEEKQPNWLNGVVDKIAHKLVKKNSNPFKNA